jgi:twinkle protein
VEIREIIQLLNGRAEDVAAMLLPNGKREGREWVIGSIAGEPGRSCKIAVEGSKRGVFSDFAAGGLSGDLLDLWQAVKGISIAEAVQEAKKYLGIQEPKFEKFSEKIFRVPVPPKAAKKLVEGSVVQQYLLSRGLSPESLAAYRIGEAAEIGPFSNWKSQNPMKGPWIVFPSFRGTVLVAVKYLHIKRKDGKKFTLVEPNCEAILFGWQAIPDNARSVILTEGEIDAITYHSYGFPALSVPFGGGKGAKQQWIDSEFPHLDRFEEIVLSLDQDEEGQKATEEIINRLGRHRCRVVTLPFKDINKCKQKGVTAAEVAKLIESAKSHDPSELKAPTEFSQAVLDEFYPPSGELPGFTLPWKMRKRPVKVLRGEVSIWTGYNGHGKSLVLLLITLVAMTQGERVCIASFEIHPRKTLFRMVRQALGKEIPEHTEITATLEWLVGKLWIFDRLGTSSPARILEVFHYAYRRYGIQQFVVDSLMKCGIATDDYTNQKKFLDELNDFANETGAHVHLVAHSRKGQDELSPPGKMDTKGTGDITDLASNGWSIWRNKIKEADLAKIEAGEPIKLTRAEVEAMPDALLTCFKSRDDRNEEGKIALFFHKWSLQYHSRNDSRPHEYCILDQTGGSTTSCFIDLDEEGAA